MVTTTPHWLSEYRRLKAQVGPDVILFFRLGDFYELFDNDAETCASILGLVRTLRPQNSNQPTSLAGVSYHMIYSALDHLVTVGHKVALAELDKSKPNHWQIVHLDTPGLCVDRVTLKNYKDKDQE